MIEELDDVILTCDLPEHKLARGNSGVTKFITLYPDRGRRP